MPSLDSFCKTEVSRINHTLNSMLEYLPESAKPLARHIINSGGKRIRPLLTVIFARLFGYSETNIHKLAASMEFLHAATLLHDDVLDGAVTRRGRPAAHTLYGITKTILAGDALLALGNSLVASFNNPELCACFSTATSCTASGEILEIESIGQCDITPERYMEIITGKTAELLAQSCALGSIAANADVKGINESKQYGRNLGIAFQIIDDCLDFLNESQTGKPVGGDLREKKLTPPARLYRESLDPEAKDRFDTFFCGEQSDDKFKFYIEEIRPFALKAREEAIPYIEKSLAALKNFPENSYRNLLNQFVLSIYERQK